MDYRMCMCMYRKYFEICIYYTAQHIAKGYRYRYSGRWESRGGEKQKQMQMREGVRRRHAAPQAPLALGTTGQAEHTDRDRESNLQFTYDVQSTSTIHIHYTYLCVCGFLRIFG